MKKAAGGSDWKDGFLFVGNELALDFVNTRPVRDGQPEELLPDLRALLRWFQAAAVLRPGEAARLTRQWSGTARAGRVFQAARKLRETLRRDVLAWEKTGAIRRSTVEGLNALLARHPMRERLRKRGRAAVREPWFQTRLPEDLLGPLAHSAATLFTAADRKRVRKCAQCVLHFRDTSKKGTRRWCSMNMCGNREKVAAYAARQRSRPRAGKSRGPGAR
ncbi:MAG TPA: ABATE domain-containing protein [Candidatus Acidoferrum sp.]|nr:ABATE domain-containing protein [Candidatus Acidoferrum sp.]